MSNKIKDQKVIQHNTKEEIKKNANKTKNVKDSPICALIKSKDNTIPCLLEKKSLGLVKVLF